MNLLLRKILKNIDFAIRYRSLCDKHNDFDNRMRGSNKKMYESILNYFHYENKYNSNGRFFHIEEKEQEILFQFNLSIKDGQIESFIYLKMSNENFENMGRLDFIPQKNDIPFERKDFNLPLFSSKEELNEILEEIFSIYEDFKREFMREFNKK